MSVTATEFSVFNLYKIPLAFDWKTFDSKACTIDGMAVGEFLTKAYTAGSGSSGSTSGYV